MFKFLPCFSVEIFWLIRDVIVAVFCRFSRFELLLFGNKNLCIGQRPRLDNCFKCRLDILLKMYDCKSCSLIDFKLDCFACRLISIITLNVQSSFEKAPLWIVNNGANKVFNLQNNPDEVNI